MDQHDLAQIIGVAGVAIAKGATDELYRLTVRAVVLAFGLFAVVAVLTVTLVGYLRSRRACEVRPPKSTCKGHRLYIYSREYGWQEVQVTRGAKRTAGGVFRANVRLVCQHITEDRQWILLDEYSAPRFDVWLDEDMWLTMTHLQQPHIDAMDVFYDDAQPYWASAFGYPVDFTVFRATDRGNVLYRGVVSNIWVS